MIKFVYLFDMLLIFTLEILISLLEFVAPVAWLRKELVLFKIPYVFLKQTLQLVLSIPFFASNICVRRFNKSEGVVGMIINLMCIITSSIKFRIAKYK